MTKWQNEERFEFVEVVYLDKNSDITKLSMGGNKGDFMCVDSRNGGKKIAKFAI